MKRRTALPVFVACLATQPAFAAHWIVDYTKSKLGFTVEWSGEPFAASFRKWQADIDFDPGDLAHSRAVVTVSLASEISDEPDFDSGLKGAEGFASARFPEARFVTSRFMQTGPNSYNADGVLSLHGLSRTIQLPFSLLFVGRTAHMSGTAHVKRTDFSLGQGEWANPVPVAFDVAVNVDLFATR